MEARCRLDTPAALTLEKYLGTHWLRGWVGHTAGLDIWRREKFPVPAGIETPDRPVRRLHIIRLRYTGSPSWRAVQDNIHIAGL